jgi:hypothetical protein
MPIATDVVCRQKALDEHADKRAAEGASEDKNTNVNWIHSF